MLSKAPAKKRTRFATIQAALIAILIASIFACVWLFRQANDAYQATHLSEDHIREVAQKESESLRLSDRLFLAVHQGTDERPEYWQAQYHADILELRSLIQEIAASSTNPLPAGMLAGIQDALSDVERIDVQIFDAALQRDQDAAEVLLVSPVYASARALIQNRLTGLIQKLRLQAEANHRLASQQFEAVRQSAIIYASLLAFAWIVGLLILGRWVRREATAERWAVQNAESRFEALSEASPVGIWYGDATGKVIYVNPALQHIARSPTREEILDVSWMEKIHPEDIGELQAKLGTIFGTTKSMEMTFRITPPNGSTRWIQMQAVPILDANQQPAGHTGTFVDITEAQEAKALLLASEARYRSVLNEQKEMLSRYDADTTILFANRAYAEMFGTTEQQILGTRWIDVIPEDQKADMLEYAQRVLSSESGVDIDWQLPHPNGSLRWIHFVNRPMTDPITGKKFVQSVATDITESRELAASLQASEARYRSVLDEQKEMVSRYDADTTILFANRANAELFGTTQQAILGTKWIDIIPEEHQAEMLASTRRLLNGDVGDDFDWPFPLPDGTPRWIHFELSPMTDPTTGKRFVQSVGTDTTEARLLSESLQASEARYRSVVDEQKELLSRYDADTTILFVNQAYAEMFGATQEELIGTQWIDHIPADQKEYMLDYVKRVLANDSRQEIDWPLPHPADGTLRHIRFEDRRMTDPVTGEFFIQSVGTDITASLEAAAKLQASEAKYRSAIDEQKDMLFQWKPDTTIFFVNRAWREFFQIDLDANPEFRWLLTVPEEERAPILEHHRRLFAGELVPPFEWPLPAPDGSMRWISFQDQLMTDEITGEIFVQSIGTDVTERRQHLIELERYTTALEQSRSAEAKHAARLSQTITELDEARRRAEEGTRAKSAFLANMSHELRTPLNAILGYSEMLIEDAAAAGNVPMGEDLGRILQSGRHLLGLINDILDLSKVEAGHMELNIEELQLTDLIREIEHTAIPLAKQHNNVFEAIYDPALGTVWTDVVRVRQILMNLMGNAFKFTENGLVTLRVNRQLIDGQDQLVLAVSDNGIGIAPADADRLFLEFTQADVSTTRRYGGTGLGLTLTKRFVELLHGTISVRSELGKGATFTVVLPATQVTEPTELRGRVAMPRQAGPEASLAPMPALEAIANSLAVSTQPLILVIDDDPIVGELLTRQLTPEGYRVEVALDGPTGLIKARELQPNLVTLDLMMPDMDGWEVLSIMKHDPMLAAIPVIIISILNDRKAVMSLGACDALVKPVSPEQLLPVLERNQRGRLTKPVLVVDDDPLVRRLLRRSLEQEGWRIVEATNGQEALAQLAIEEPALVLLDLMMPVMDGFEFLAHLRDLPEHDDLPIVVLTAMDLTTTQREFLQSAAQGLLQKSNGLRREVIMEIKQVLGRSNAVNLSGYEGALLA